MVGASGAVIRSAIMVSLALAAVAIGRQNDALNSLALACGLMVAWWPPQLWDVGFQLSVAATFGLIWLSPAMETWLSRLPSAIRGNLAVALAAQAMTMPILAANFHLISLVSPLANLAALWAVAPLMACGMAVALVGWIWAPAAAVVGWAAWLFATWIAEIGAAARRPALGSGARAASGRRLVGGVLRAALAGRSPVGRRFRRAADGQAGRSAPGATPSRERWPPWAWRPCWSGRPWSRCRTGSFTSPSWTWAKATPS